MLHFAVSVLLICSSSANNTRKLRKDRKDKRVNFLPLQLLAHKDLVEGLRERKRDRKRDSVTCTIIASFSSMFSQGHSDSGSAHFSAVTHLSLFLSLSLFLLHTHTHTHTHTHVRGPPGYEITHQMGKQFPPVNSSFNWMQASFFIHAVWELRSHTVSSAVFSWQGSSPQYALTK